MSIGSFYSAAGVVVGQAMGLVAPQNTPMAADAIALFDEATWASTKVDTNTATGGTITLTLSGGPLDSVGPVTTGTIAEGAAASVVATAITTALTAAGVLTLAPVVTGAGSVGSPWLIALSGAGGAEVVITSTSTSLTGGTGTGAHVVAPAWTPLGATQAAWQVNYSPTTQDITIEEQQTPVGRQITAADFEITANLSEDSMANLAQALNATRTITAASTGIYGSDQMALQNSLPIVAVILETSNKKGYPRRYYVPGATCAAQVGQTFARASTQHLIPVTFSAVCDVSTILVRSITANKQ